MGKDIRRSFKYNRSKIFTPTLKKPVLSSSSNHTSYTTSLSQTIISSHHENKDSTAIQNMSEILNKDDDTVFLSVGVVIFDRLYL